VSIAAGRDLVATRQALHAWLAGRLGVEDVSVSALVVPRSGMSNETVFGEAEWVSPDGAVVRHRLVVRIQPTAHQLFVRPDVLREGRVMQTLAQVSDVPVPPVLFTEADPSVLGAPFVVMEQVPGRVPPDVPSWHARGWTVELSPDGRRVLYDNALKALAALHRVDWQTHFTFLSPADSSSLLDAYVRQIRHWYEWCLPILKYTPEIIADALDYVERERPDLDRTSVVWGDARPGNVIFRQDLGVAALLDWETATIGPPELDLGWWLMFEEFLCEAQGLSRLPGVAGRDETIERYAALSGHDVGDVRYFEIVAGLVLSLINSRLADLLISSGRTSADLASTYVTRVTSMLDCWLA
jgi:aminoglycoside phosphotransferase (APT) family kinase protein